MLVKTTLVRVNHPACGGVWLYDPETAAELTACPACFPTTRPARRRNKARERLLRFLRSVT